MFKNIIQEICMKKMLSILCTVVLVCTALGYNVLAAENDYEIMPTAAKTDSSRLTDGVYWYDFYLECTNSDSWRTMNIYLTAYTDWGNLVYNSGSGAYWTQVVVNNPNDNEMIIGCEADYYVSGTAIEEHLEVFYN